MKLGRIITFVTTGFALAGIIAGTGCVEAMAAERTTAEYAIEIALADAGLSEDDVEIDDVEKGKEQGASVYEIEFRTDSKEYEYDIAAADGEIVSAGWDLEDPELGGKQINQAMAKNIALEYAGLSENKVTFTKTKNGTENGIPVFEIKFEDSDAEYEFDIAKEGGEILNYSRKIKSPASVGAEGIVK